MKRTCAWLATVLTLAMVGCSAGTSVLSPTSSPSPTASIATNPLASPSLSGDFAIDASGLKLRIICWGTGDPTIFLETGGPPIDEFTGSDLVGRLATERRVCLYNHLGQPPSDPAPNEPREAEDVAAVFHGLTRAAGIDPPFVLFGRSFGGMVVTFYASKYPADVAGVVVFDSPSPNAEMTVEDFPEGVWNYPGNVEHVNVLTGYENRFGKDPVHFDAPLIVISPTSGEGNPKDERYWLQTSQDATQVVLQGGTEVIDTEAERIAEEILSLAAG
jgi:pimeloyl-ACP methyl ester carboxylesterase